MIVMSDYPHNKKKCFGVLEEVFPMGEDGLRHTPDACMTCERKTECLKIAVQQSNGLRLAEERIDRAYQSQNISFLARWSKKKTIDRQRRQSKYKK